MDLKAINESLQGKLPGYLGMEILEVHEGRVVGTMPVEERHHQPMGLLHGGASLALAETVASIGGWYLVAPENKVVVGQEINANHLRPVTSGTLRAEASILHKGKNSQVWEIRIFHEDQGLICISRCTLAVLNPK